MYRYASLIILAVGLFFSTSLQAQNHYFMSVSQNKTLCVGNNIIQAGQTVVQMRCYDTTNTSKYFLTLNTTIAGNVITSAGDIACSFIRPNATDMNINCSGNQNGIPTIIFTFSLNLQTPVQ